MRSWLPYILTGSGIIALMILVEMNRPPELSWEESYSRYDEIPFGNYLLYQCLPQLFPGLPLSSPEQPLTVQADSLRDGTFPANYIFIDRILSFDEYELATLLHRVGEGSHVFMAASQYEGAIRDSLFLHTDYPDLFSDSSGIRFTQAGPHSEKLFTYPQREWSTMVHFTATDSNAAEILGVNARGKPNLLRLRRGNGSLIFSCTPLAFTNYYMVDSLNHAYIARALSCLPLLPVVWDEYYKERRRQLPDTPLRYVLSEPALRNAWYLALLTALLFLFTQSRRRQRIIPLIEPLRNTTLDYIATISRLYLQTGNHRNIAEKKIGHFLEYLRSTHGLPTGELSPALAATLTMRLGLKEEVIPGLFRRIEECRNKAQISEQELLQLNRDIDLVYQKHR